MGAERPAPDWQVSVLGAAARMAAERLLGANAGTLVHEATVVRASPGRVVVHLAWTSPGRVADRPRALCMTWAADARPDHPSIRRRVLADSLQRLADGITLTGA